jgi:hypothetical protein
VGEGIGGHLLKQFRVVFGHRDNPELFFIIESPDINSLHHGTAGLGEQMFAFGNLVSHTVM